MALQALRDHLFEQDGPADQAVAAIATPGSTGKCRSRASWMRRDTSLAAVVTSRTSARRRRGISS